MLKSRVKECIVLLIFAAFLREYLTFSTIGFVLLGVTLVLLSIKPSKLIRNIMALGIFFSYWYTYGKVIDPEIGLNFLVSIIILKLLESEDLRDRYMIFFGLLLIISAGSLFERSISYTFFFAGSFIALIQIFYSQLELRWRFRDLGGSFLWVFPLTLLLFFMVPRVMSPIPFQPTKSAEGEIGYRTNVDPSDVAKVVSSNRPAFRALVSQRLTQRDLYWKGNSISTTDGWAWTLGPSDRTEPVWSNRRGPVNPRSIKQEIRLESKEDYFFALDAPLEYSVHGATHLVQGESSLRQERSIWSQSYEVSSLLGPQKTLVDPTSRIFLRSPLTKSRKAWINRTFPGTTLEEVVPLLQRFFAQQGFHYSLEPGKVGSFEEFMRRRIGFCSHYASATGLILRAKGIPSRLVSGFMGGNYNPYGKLYLVSQNDAHVWVEAFDGEVWRRLDPTEWIVPARTELGGDGYMNELAAQKSIFPKGIKNHFAWVNDAQLWFQQWDFRFYQWLEGVDYYEQEAWLQRLRLKRKWLYFILPLITGVFLLIYVWNLKRKSSTVHSLDQRLWMEFRRRSQLQGITLSGQSVSLMKSTLETSAHPRKQEFLDLFERLVKFSFRGSAPGEHAVIFAALKRL